MYARKRVTEQSTTVGFARSMGLSRRMTLFASYSGFILTDQTTTKYFFVKLLASLVLLMMMILLCIKNNTGNAYGDFTKTYSVISS